jgi:hypothetical protein
MEPFQHFRGAHSKSASRDIPRYLCGFGHGPRWLFPLRKKKKKKKKKKTGEKNWEAEAGARPKVKEEGDDSGLEGRDKGGRLRDEFGRFRKSC